MPGDAIPGWYVTTPAGRAGPFRFRADALAARPLGTAWPVQYASDCGCGGLCDSAEPCPMPKAPAPLSRPPCACGNSDAEWRDCGTGPDPDTHRRYLCDACYARSA